MELLEAHDLILPLHRYPENNFTEQQSRDAFTVTLKALAAEAGKRNVTLHLRLTLGKPPWSLGEGLHWLERVGAPNLKLAVSTALLEGKPPGTDDVARLKQGLGLWLLAGGRKDVAGTLWDVHATIRSSPNADSLMQLLALNPGAPVLMDAHYDSPEEEYLDVAALERWSAPAGR
jgi:hypothetical protein